MKQPISGAEGAQVLCFRAEQPFTELSRLFPNREDGLRYVAYTADLDDDLRIC